MVSTTATANHHLFHAHFGLAQMLIVAIRR
jgi:hypothetical protein